MLLLLLCVCVKWSGKVLTASKVYVHINAHLWILFIMATAPDMRDLTELATVASTIAEVVCKIQHLTPRISQVQHLQGKFLLLYSGIAEEGPRGGLGPQSQIFH